MPDSEPKLDFSLPNRSHSSPAGSGKLTTVLLLVIALLVATNLGVLLTRGGGAGAGTSVSGEQEGALSPDGLKPEAQRALALKLEAQGLNEVAAEAWEDFLGMASLDAKDASAIWYRIAKLHQDAGSFESALAAYYRCEALDPESGLKSEIGRRAQESLEAMGKFAALKQELASRVTMDGSGAAAEVGDVVAEIGARKITRAELEQQMEASIENQLARFAGRMPEDQMMQQKESMLKQFSTDSQRLQFLQSYIVQEILYRKARESKLLEKPVVRAQLQEMERSLLAQQMMSQEVESKLNIVESDVETYYEANKARYVEPESAAISQLVVASEDAALALAEELQGADVATFATKASEVSLDESTKATGGELTAELKKGGATPPGVDPAIVAAAFNTSPGTLAPQPVKTDEGYHLVFVRERRDGQQKPFETVRNQVYQELRAKKQQETEQQLMNRLRDEYNVVIHQSKFKRPEGDQ